MVGLLGIALVLSRSFDALVNTFVLGSWPFYALSVAGIYRLRRVRRRCPGLKVLGYPVVPAVFIVPSVGWSSTRSSANRSRPASH
jgi:APA family basic amino acid/polyamine antiporter